VVVVTTSAVDDHDTGRGHPERAARLDAALEGVRRAALGDDLAMLAPRAATRVELERVHDPAYIDALERFCIAGGGMLDPDTVATSGSWGTALAAAGSGLAAIDALDRGDATSALVLARPPGHHATRARAQGFCLLNNVAVAAAALVARGERVLVVDWDVHHGNGTQDIFWDEPNVLYASTHQWPAYPGTGRISETGGPAAPGLTVNFPLPPGATGDAAWAALDDVVGPLSSAFAPTWVLVSAGFDAHRADALADLRWSAADYVGLTRRVMAMAPAPERVVAFLEGGYDLDALAASVEATVTTLAGSPTAPDAPTSGGPGLDVVREVAARRR
jgi:acetoin utilization deacetylase AcuC-like enzyme